MWYYWQLYWFKQRALSKSILQYDHEIHNYCPHGLQSDNIPGSFSYCGFLHRFFGSVSNMHSSLCLGRYPISIRWHAGLLLRSNTRNGTLAKGFLLGNWLLLARRNPSCVPLEHVEGLRGAGPSIRYLRCCFYLMLCLLIYSENE